MEYLVFIVVYISLIILAFVRDKVSDKYKGVVSFAWLCLFIALVLITIKDAIHL